MKIKTKHGKYIQDVYSHDIRLTNYEEEIKKMIDDGHNSITIDGMTVTLQDSYVLDEERVVVVGVEV